MKGARLRRMGEVDTDFIDASNVFIELNSPSWRVPLRVSVRNFMKDMKMDVSNRIDNKTIVIDPHTLKLKIDDSLLNHSNVIHEPLKNGNINPYTEPKDGPGDSYLHLRSDGNYLYIWAGNRWKRVKLVEWGDK